MRLIRLAALFGSLMLLTATVVLLVERRSDVRDDQIGRARAAADAALVSVTDTLAELDRAVTQLVTVLDPDPTTAELERAARSLDDVADGASACVAATTGSACSGGDLLGLSLTGRLMADDDVVSGGVGLAVDSDADRIIAVGNSVPPGNDDALDASTVVIAVPVSSLISTAAREQIERRGADAMVVAVGSVPDGADDRDERGVVDGLVTIIDSIGERFGVGALEVTVSVDGEIGMFGGSPSFFALLIGLGSVLLVLAGGTFLADRRNLEEQAATDELTGLANRREFERLAGEAGELADRFGTGLTFMVVDLDSFKQINDTLGHQYGDLVLKGVADRLDRAIRDTDTVGRWGGDEFVILLPGLDEASAIRSSAERITTMLSSTPVVGDTVMRASIGAAAFPRHGSTLDALLRTADAAMYAAKTTGVSYRVADADLARRANGLTEDGQPAADELVVTTNYVGPDRRAAAALGDELRGDDDTPQFIERSLESPPGDQVATPTAPAVEAPTAPADEVPTDAPAGAPSDAPVDR